MLSKRQNVTRYFYYNKKIALFKGQFYILGRIMRDVVGAVPYIVVRA